MPDVSVTSMSNGYNELLDATISHLESLRNRGIQYVSASEDLLKNLHQPAVSEALPPTSKAGSRPADSESSRRHRESREVSDEFDSPPLNRNEKEAAMSQLRETALACQKCPNLADARRTVVFGVGDIHSPLMFVGEAPGADEDRQGEPFVGNAGQLLTRIIQAMGLTREQVYIANVLKCRPDTPGQAYGNRKPTPDEMATCKPYLLKQIEIIRPKVMVALGVTAMEGLFEKRKSITRIRGQFQTFKGVSVMPTYHPSYLLHNDSIHEKRKVWEDMLQVMERLGMNITEKQRGFFRKR